MLSARLAERLPALTPAQIKSALQSSARAFPTEVTDSQTGQQLPVCQVPTSTSGDQLECICTTSTCGAGLLDASAAVAAALSLSGGGGDDGGSSGGGGGGGAMSIAWLLALCASVALLRRRGPQAPASRSSSPA
jgi:serine protease